ncbi:Receptor-type guanylate cyclase gcy [Seminavis robusta]|uniref:guanylate cyclase n=1 Tax=Seminavis robusta TaxID=568900 RepID=A0A9N8EBV5_9STRA|nr:Receptor-type guanylate cyclase gcy [Seminavis robusta]|eukprot:Sro897_g217480.1 Receptor-type guanylate cyclase gcy (1101) ;mRNA; f:17321-21171
MHGVMFMILGCFFTEEQGGEEVWDEVMTRAGLEEQVKQKKGFLLRSYYGDELFMALVQAGAELKGVTVDDILAPFGHFFGSFLIHRGASSSLLQIQGTTLRTWLSNLNGMHDHIRMSYPGGSSPESKFIAPEFWCEDGDETPEQGSSILLHYFSLRGETLVSCVPGIVVEVAAWQFDLEIQMTKLEKEESSFTTWKITAVDPAQCWKLTSTSHIAAMGADGKPTRKQGVGFVSITGQSNGQGEKKIQCPFALLQKTLRRQCGLQSSHRKDLYENPALDGSENDNDNNNGDESISAPTKADKDSLQMTLEQMQSIFPFHLLVDKEFTILSVGDSLPSLMKKQQLVNDFDTPFEMLGQHIEMYVKITRPQLPIWDWKALKKFSDQNFFLTAISATSQQPLEFKGSMFPVGGTAVMFALNPYIRNVQEMQSFGLFMNDLPLHGFQRDSVFLSEYITHEADRAQSLDKLSRKLEIEQELSQTLLYNMLPVSVADDLRKGHTVEPKEFEHVTLFFSDIVGFTSICDQVDPWSVIDLLNQLYSCMDYLAEKFKLYKVETIGDAYMCCSGLPFPDENHAENIANFAVAVMECVQHIKSPVDCTTPINLRIGIHTGNCTAGVVGTRSPHYALFGDMINTTSRHESTGLPGKIQCSSELFGRLVHDSPHDNQQFHLSPRGLVQMKGKGERFTYWLEEATDHNEFANPVALQALFREVGKMLEQETWRKRKYFGRSVSDTASTVNGLSTSPLTEEEEEKKEGSTNLQADIGDSLEDTPPLESEKCRATLTDLWYKHHIERAELVAKVYETLLPILQLCMLDNSNSKPSMQEAVLAEQLFGFIDLISKSFRRPSNPYHCFRRAAHVVAWSNRLFSEIQDGDAGVSGKVDPGPWYRLALTLAALLRDCKHDGVTDQQLQTEKSAVHEMYGGKKCQAKYSLTHGLDILEEDFPDLHKELRWGYPSFFSILRKAALVTNPKQEFELAIKFPVETERDLAERTESTLSLVLKLADYGYFALEFEQFNDWMEALFAERRVANIKKRGVDPSPTWHEDRHNLFKDEVLPLVALYEETFPDSCALRDGVLANRAALNKKCHESKGLFPRRGGKCPKSS